jgi:hypothetical protein
VLICGKPASRISVSAENSAGTARASAMSVSIGNSRGRRSWPMTGAAATSSAHIRNRAERPIVAAHYDAPAAAR